MPVLVLIILLQCTSYSIFFDIGTLHIRVYLFWLILALWNVRKWSTRLRQLIVGDTFILIVQMWTLWCSSKIQGVHGSVGFIIFFWKGNEKIFNSKSPRMVFFFKSIFALEWLKNVFIKNRFVPLIDQSISYLNSMVDKAAWKYCTEPMLDILFLHIWVQKWLLFECFN